MRTPYTLLRPLKKIVEKTLGVRILKQLPHGMDVFADISRLTPDVQMRTIFDVGANVGQSALPITSKYESAVIYCFEPATSTYAALREAVAHFPNIKTYNVAVGDRREFRALELNDESLTYRILPEGETSSSKEAVELITLDDFCDENGVEHINFLKVDTEGFDLKVLLGASNLLGRSGVDFVQTEVGMSATNDIHVPFQQVLDLMHSHGYAIFGFYTQMHEWKFRKPYLRRADVVFISPSTARSINLP